MVKGKTEKSYNVTRPEPVLKAYRDRLKVLKKAQELSAMDEIPKAVQHYSLYLNTLAQYFDVPENVYEALMNAGSHGQYFDRNIKKAGYQFQKM